LSHGKGLLKEGVAWGASELGIGAELGIYRLLCQLAPDDVA